MSEGNGEVRPRHERLRELEQQVRDSWQRRMAGETPKYGGHRLFGFGTRSQSRSFGSNTIPTQRGTMSYEMLEFDKTTYHGRQEATHEHTLTAILLPKVGNEMAGTTTITFHWGRGNLEYESNLRPPYDTVSFEDPFELTPLDGIRGWSPENQLKAFIGLIDGEIVTPEANQQEQYGET